MQAIFPWWAAAIIFSFAVSSYTLINQQVKIKSSVLATFSGLGVATTLFPICFFIVGFPTNIEFYIYTIIGGIAVATIDNRSFYIADKYGAKILSFIGPINIIITTLIWWIIDFESFKYLLERPLALTGIIISLILAYTAMISMQKTSKNKQALIEAIPLIIANIAIAITIKKAIMIVSDNFITGITSFIFISNLFNGIINLYLRNTSGKIESFLTKRNIKIFIFLVLITLILNISVNYALFMSPNPGYVGVIGNGFSIMIVHIYNTIIGRKDSVNIKTGILFIISAIILVMLVR